MRSRDDGLGGMADDSWLAPMGGVPWAWLSGLGLIHTGLAYSLTYVGMARLRTDRIAVFQFIYRAIAFVIDLLLYEQRLGSLQLSGIALMAVAIWFAEHVPRQQQRVLPLMQVPEHS